MIPSWCCPPAKTSRIATIDTAEGELDSAHVPMAVTLRLTDEIGIRRGDMLVHASVPPSVGTRFDAQVVRGEVQ